MAIESRFEIVSLSQDDFEERVKYLPSELLTKAEFEKMINNYVKSVCITDITQYLGSVYYTTLKQIVSFVTNLLPTCLPEQLLQYLHQYGPIPWSIVINILCEPNSIILLKNKAAVTARFKLNSLIQNASSQTLYDINNLYCKLCPVQKRKLSLEDEYQTVENSCMQLLRTIYHLKKTKKMFRLYELSWNHL